MRRTLLKIALAATLVSALPGFAADEAGATYGAGGNSFSLATGSPGELGLLKLLAEEFSRRADAQMVWVKAGTGASLKLLQEKKVDMVMVHAPAQVDKALKDGWASGKTLIGSNEFYIVGPKSDPAGIGQATSAADAYQRVAKAGARFVSRGDNSGTHQKEMQIWQKAGIQPAGTAEKFVAFVASPAGQKIIASYGRDRFGEGLYNDEAYARQYDK
ncbi:MAG: putative ABC transporter substrate binding protein precursor [Parcubacteria group bacterium Athens0416_74]|nr:MAG: putative ABC transporter substrate binding protein precursor [Parcubacteria group bacterium Athens0416_74]